MKKAILAVIVLAIFTTMLIMDKPVHEFEEVKVKSLLTGAATLDENLLTAKENCKYYYQVDNDVLCWYGEPEHEPETEEPEIVMPECTCPPGTSETPPDPKQVLAELQKYTCVKGASIEFPVITQNGCPPCYKDAEITIHPGKLYCDTSCGKVECGTSKTIPTEKGELTCHCSWGGWKHAGGYQFVPMAGVKV